MQRALRTLIRHRYGYLALLAPIAREGCDFAPLTQFSTPYPCKAFANYRTQRSIADVRELCQTWMKRNICNFLMQICCCVILSLLVVSKVVVYPCTICSELPSGWSPFLYTIYPGNRCRSLQFPCSNITLFLTRSGAFWSISPHSSVVPWHCRHASHPWTRWFLRPCSL